MAGVRIYDRNIHKTSPYDFRTYINTLTSIAPNDIISKDNGYIIQFNEEQHGNFIFEQRVILDLQSRNMSASFTDDTKMEREIYIPNPPNNIYAMPDNVLAMEIQRTNQISILGIQKFTSRKTGRNYIILTPQTNEIAKRVINNAKIIIGIQEVPVQAKKSGKTVNGTGPSRHLQPPSQRRFQQHQGNNALINQWTSQQYQPQIQSRQTYPSTPSNQGGVSYQHNSTAQHGHITTGIPQLGQTQQYPYHTTSITPAQRGNPTVLHGPAQHTAPTANITGNMYGPTATSNTGPTATSNNGPPLTSTAHYGNSNHHVTSSTGSTYHGNSNNYGISSTDQAYLGNSNIQGTINTPALRGNTTVLPGQAQHTATASNITGNMYGTTATSNTGPTATNSNGPPITSTAHYGNSNHHVTSSTGSTYHGNSNNYGISSTDQAYLGNTNIQGTSNTGSAHHGNSNMGPLFGTSSAHLLSSPPGPTLPGNGYFFPNNQDETIKMFIESLSSMCKTLSGGLEYADIYVRNFNQVLRNHNIPVINMPQMVIECSKQLYAFNKKITPPSSLHKSNTPIPPSTLHPSDNASSQNASSTIDSDTNSTTSKATSDPLKHTKPPQSPPTSIMSKTTTKSTNTPIDPDSTTKNSDLSSPSFSGPSTPINRSTPTTSSEPDHIPINSDLSSVSYSSPLNSLNKSNPTTSIELDTKSINYDSASAPFSGPTTSNNSATPSALHTSSTITDIDTCTPTTKSPNLTDVSLTTPLPLILSRYNSPLKLVTSPLLSNILSTSSRISNWISRTRKSTVPFHPVKLIHNPYFTA